MTGGTIKVYISSISCNREHRKQQQDIINILECHQIDFERIDVTDPAQTEAKQFMRENSVALNEGKTPLPPQIFNEDNYCGNYTMFLEALEDNQLFQFLKLAAKVERSDAQVTVTGGRAPEEVQTASEDQEKAENGSGDAN